MYSLFAQGHTNVVSMGFETTLFWSVTGMVLILTMVLSEAKCRFLTACMVAAYFVALHFFGEFSIFGYAYENPHNFVLFVFLYFLTGLFWAVLKWFWFVREKIRVYQNWKTSWLRSYKIEGTEIPDFQKKYWQEYLQRENNYRLHDKITSTSPQVKEHKEDIIYWILFWIPSLCDTICGCVFDLTWFLLGSFTRTLQRISDYMFSEAKSDIV